MNAFIGKWHIIANMCLSGDLTCFTFITYFDFTLIMV